MTSAEKKLIHSVELTRLAVNYVEGGLERWKMNRKMQIEEF